MRLRLGSSPSVRPREHPSAVRILQCIFCSVPPVGDSTPAGVCAAAIATVLATAANTCRCRSRLHRRNLNARGACRCPPAPQRARMHQAMTKQSPCRHGAGCSCECASTHALRNDIKRQKRSSYEPYTHKLARKLPKSWQSTGGKRAIMHACERPCATPRHTEPALHVASAQHILVCGGIVAIRYLLLR